MEEAKNKNLSFILIALVVLSGIINFVALKGLNGESISLEDVQDVVAEEIAKIEFPEPAPVSTAVETPVSTAVESSSEYTLTKAEFEDEETEAKALELATESVQSKDFKKAVFDKLVLFGEDIEEYKDITEVKIKESDVDDDEVKFEVIVYYFTDDDEDNTMKAYLDDFTVVIDELDFDEEFEDAEADESYMTTLVISKVKEI